MKINKLLYTLLAAVTMFFTACSPDEYSLGDMKITSDDLVEGIAYTVTHDADNPNIIYLTSLLPTKYTILWNHPQGRSQESSVTLKIPFAGEYTVQMGVETQAGIVYGPETTFTVDDFCAEFVDNELWTYISGGVGNSKRWYLDVDSKGQCRYFVGPVYFYGTDDNWNSVTLGQTIDGDSWSWAADWGGNSWVLSDGAQDYGYMEFDLIGGANVTVYDAINNTTTTGTYMIDTDNYTIKLTDVDMLHDPSGTSKCESWGNITLLALDEDHAQFAVLRTEDPCLLSYNFISEEYRENWTPEEESTDVVPELASDWRDYVEPKTSNIMKFKLDEEQPFDWCNLDGTNKNITTFAAVSDAADLAIEFNHKDNTWTVTTPSGDSYTGTYSLSDDGIYTFDQALPVVQLSQSGNANFKSNADNTLRILSYTVDDYTGSLSDIWLGSRCTDDQGSVYQYLGYHFVLQTGSDDGVRYTSNMNYFNTGWTFINSDNVFVTGDGSYTFTVSGSDSSPYGIYIDFLKVLKDNPNFDATVTSIKVDGTSISFDDASIERCLGDDETTYRRYILNPWQSVPAFPDASVFSFTSSIEITLNVVMDSGAPTIPASVSAKKNIQKHKSLK
ncbi:MAG: hypothetical protein Q4D41_02705 [Prevotellaceae bacterium]|nr:hypothetical protein [Prevotellaceae bacterium]